MSFFFRLIAVHVIRATRYLHLRITACYKYVKFSLSSFIKTMCCEVLSQDTFISSVIRDQAMS